MKTALTSLPTFGLKYMYILINYSNSIIIIIDNILKITIVNYNSVLNRNINLG